MMALSRGRFFTILALSVKRSNLEARSGHDVRRDAPTRLTMPTTWMGTHRTRKVTMILEISWLVLLSLKRKMEKALLFAQLFIYLIIDLI